MLGVEPAVPVDFGVIKVKDAILFSSFDIQIWVPSQEFVVEGAVFALGADFVNFVDDGADMGVFVH